MESVQVEGLEVAPALYNFVNQEALPHTGVKATAFWRGLASLIRDLAPRNAALLQRREALQSQIDHWHRAHPGRVDPNAYKTFLYEIGYLLPEGADFCISATQIDPEIALIAGPQLVVPASNPRYAVHAANARWGSLYDALYGTDVIPEDDETKRGAHYNPARGAKVIAFVRKFLDQYFALTEHSHRNAISYTVDGEGLAIKLDGGSVTRLADPHAFAGYQGDAEAPNALLLKHHGLHVEIRIDRMHHIGRQDRAGIVDVQLESAVTTIQDFENSACAVDAEEKVSGYRTWLGLMKGTLHLSFEKDGKQLQRKLHTDRRYHAPNGQTLMLPGRSLMMVRTVGQHVLSDAITLDGQPAPEAFIDAAVSALIGIHDLNAGSVLRNSHADSIYIVKPKMHGPEEVAFADELFARVEDMLSLPRYTIKMGLMDEERRTSLNLKECIRAAQHRLAFVNTGFIDRIGDEIHTFMEAGPVLRKQDIRTSHCLDVYERHNVDTAVACGLPGKAQIGKGTWLMPDKMAAMVHAKLDHLHSGASASWVSSPTAATLHALNYFEVDVAQAQAVIWTKSQVPLDALIPSMMTASNSWSEIEIAEELHSNLQSILGYVVRWIDFGVGCSKVPGYGNQAFLEDRATLRVSTQHVANWLRHGVCSEAQVMQALREVARAIDAQHAGNPAYAGMSNNYESSIAFQTASDLVFRGREQPSGYTGAILHARRRQKKCTSN